MIIATTPTPFMIDGIVPVDFHGRAVFMTDVQWTIEPHFSEETVLSGDTYLTYRIVTRDGVKGPTGATRNIWTCRGITDETGFNTLSKIHRRGSVHTMNSSALEVEHFDGDATTLTFETMRPMMGNLYGPSAAPFDDGINAGGAPNYAWQVAIYNRFTGTFYTPVWNVAPAATTEVRIDNVDGVGIKKFQTLTFHTAPGNYADIFRVDFLALYTVSFALSGWDLGSDADRRYLIGYQATLKELGS